MSKESVFKQKLARKRDKHMMRPAEPVFIACETLDFSWLSSEIRKVKYLRSLGKSINEIADIIGRLPEEVQILFIDWEVMNGARSQRRQLSL
jgi:hypothetical protein